ncbi:hypothetical protein [Streptomyces sp. W4I9-2]|uniref:hypothetical protein n=1 Tax=Streptomyces sp. W4I9-2 TaxID=3042297 RepID=UPI0027883A2A|nr:hypothetical protein [Streptomyces sp. W4I9-2]MDQ0694295.1 hypothetical protein [Streptomyces sp. W4I9-2]
MTPRTETVTVSHYLCDTPPVITGEVAGSIVRSLKLTDRRRDLKAERDYADSVTSGYVTLPAGCSIPAPELVPTADELNSIWAELAPNPLDGFSRLLRDIAP